MTPEPPSGLSSAQSTLPILSFCERRILGVLVEKAKTTPDVYPLSLNSLVTGCNQKSNRDPIMNLSDTEIEEALTGLQKKGLAVKIVGGRVERWRHLLYEFLHVGKVELAILAELLLRGPQTEGELRGRVSRMEPVDDLDALRAALQPLAERRLVVYLTPEGRRGTVLTHGFHAPEELERLRAASLGAAPAAPAEMPTSGSVELPTTSVEIAALRAELTKLQAEVARMAEELRVIKEGLGL